MSDRNEHVFDGKPDERQAGDIQPCACRPRYRALTGEEKALHDAIKGKADELLALFRGSEAGALPQPRDHGA